MRFYTYFKAATYLLVLSAFMSLALTDEIASPYLMVIALGIAGGIIQERFDLSTLSRVIVMVSVPFLLADFFIISKDILLAFTHLLILLTSARLLSLRTDSDYSQLYLLTFFDLLAAAALAINLSFAFTFTLYLVSATWVLLLFHIKREVEVKEEVEINRGELDSTVNLRFFLGIGGIAVFSLVVTLAIFFILPRVGIGLFSKKPGKVLKTSGFADKVDFGSIGPVTLDPTTVMRVELPGFGIEMGSIYLRGGVLASFNGATWEKERSRRETVKKEGTDFILSEGTHPLVRQEIILDPIDSDVIFGMARVMRLSGRFTFLLTDGSDSVYLPGNPTSRFQYTAYSDISTPKAQELDADRGAYPPEVLSAYTKTPPASERVKDLALSITDNAEGTHQKAVAIERYLKKNYSYTLEPKRDESLPPVEDFLFKNREGYCDHFSTAMAILLREISIPTRLVTGYVTSEWNDLGRFYTVRQSNAHSWVEVYFPSYGWITFDPTPPAISAEENRVISSVSKYIGYMRLKWDRYIVNFTLQDQVNAAREARRRTESGRESLLKVIAALRAGIGKVWIPLLILGAAASVIYLTLSRKWRGGGKGPLLRKKGTVPFYQEMLKILARKGVIRPEGMTPREFARHVFSEKGSEYRGVIDVTEVFERVRYGGFPLGLKETESLNNILEGMRKV
ncbi:MAG: DUF3488 and transglutaminase-like domain-containing protein [Deltaproteobacteria bacterium]|nr:DUF3488 and transglutaminase-like domain-containing protein [Deltaproteobacteria bacterium]